MRPDVLGLILFSAVVIAAVAGIQYALHRRGRSRRSARDEIRMRNDEGWSDTGWWI